MFETKSYSVNRSAASLREADFGTVEKVGFASASLVLILAAAVFSGIAPLQFAMATVFLFAGPHNWVEVRYFLSRLPSRFGPFRRFFLISFSGVFFLSLLLAALIFLMQASLITGETGKTIYRIWTALFFLWLLALKHARKARVLDSSPAPVKRTELFESKPDRLQQFCWLSGFALLFVSALYKPDYFGLAILYLHPLIGLLILERELRRSRPQLLPVYHKILVAIPVALSILFWQLYRSPCLAVDSTIDWQIAQRAGSFMLPNLSSHMIVALHTFLQVIHYGVWLLAIPFATAAFTRRKWSPERLPAARNSRRIQALIAFVFAFSTLMVLALWLAFIADYSEAWQLYSTVAYVHVLAEIPFLLWML